MTLTPTLTHGRDAVKLTPVWPLQILIKQIESSDNVHTISNAIGNLLSLTQDGPQLFSIIAKVRVGFGLWGGGVLVRSAPVGTITQNLSVRLLWGNYRFISAEELWRECAALKPGRLLF